MASTDLGYLLHSRPYRDTSVIGDFLLQHYGRVSLLYRGVRKAGKQGARGRLLQPFNPLAVSFDGHNELKTGRLLEPAGTATMLTGFALYSGLYLNELLVRLLHREEPLPALFQDYVAALGQLREGPLEATLRRFEQRLLAELGYQLILDQDVDGRPIEPDLWYLYQADLGFSVLRESPRAVGAQRGCFRGAHLLAMEQQLYDDDAVAQAAKQLSRLALAPHLGDRPLRSRELFK